MNYDEVKIGEVFVFRRVISEKDVFQFAKLTGDTNCLHTDKEFAKRSIFKKNISHGMLGASLFSTLIGVHCPGEKALYLSQTINFKLPIYFGDEVEVRGEVIEKCDSLKIITIKTDIINNKKIAINGVAKAKFLDYE